MIALQIEHIGKFMNQLLLQDTFDRFFISEAQITTFITFSIDGQMHQEFYEDDSGNNHADNVPEGENVHQLNPQARWKDVRPFCLQIMKGRHLPLSFRFVFQLSPGQIRRFLENSDLSYAPDNVLGLFLNIQYRNQILTVTTGSSLRIFSMDHTLDQTWDNYIRRFFTSAGLD